MYLFLWEFCHSPPGFFFTFTQPPAMFNEVLAAANRSGNR